MQLLRDLRTCAAHRQLRLLLALPLRCGEPFRDDLPVEGRVENPLAHVAAAEIGERHDRRAQQHQHRGAEEPVVGREVPRPGDGAGERADDAEGDHGEQAGDAPVAPDAVDDDGYAEQRGHGGGEHEHHACAGDGDHAERDEGGDAAQDQRRSARRGHREHLGCRVESPEKLMLSFYPIHSTNKHSSAQVLTRKHLFAHDKQACRPVIGNCIGEDYILEMLVLFGEDFCKKRALV